MRNKSTKFIQITQVVSLYVLALMLIFVTDSVCITKVSKIGIGVILFMYGNDLNKRYKIFKCLIKF